MNIVLLYFLDDNFDRESEYWSDDLIGNFSDSFENISFLENKSIISIDSEEEKLETFSENKTFFDKNQNSLKYYNLTFF